VETGNSVSMSYFGLYQLSLKLKKLLDISCKDQERAFEYYDIAAQTLKTMEEVLEEDFVAKWNHHNFPYQNVKTILDDAHEVQEHLEKVRLASRDKAIIALAKALPFPREVLYVLLDKMIEIQEENSDEGEVWRVEEVTESEKLYGHGLDGQKFLDLYIAMMEIYEGLTRLQIFWKGGGLVKAWERTRRCNMVVIEADENESETEDEWDDDDDSEWEVDSDNIVDENEMK